MVALISRQPLVSFFVLAFALTWLLFLPWMAGGGKHPLVHLRAGARRLRRRSADRGLDGGEADPGGDRAMEGRAGLVPGGGGCPRAAARGSPDQPLLGAPAPNWARSRRWARSPLGWDLLVFSGPLGEEPGWRGFALPSMLSDRARWRRACCWACLVGMAPAAWAGWRPDAIRLDQRGAGGGGVHLALAEYRGSVLLAILMHASHQNSVRYLGRVYEGATRCTAVDRGHAVGSGGADHCRRSMAGSVSRRRPWRSDARPRACVSPKPDRFHPQRRISP